MKRQHNQISKGAGANRGANAQNKRIKRAPGGVEAARVKENEGEGLLELLRGRDGKEEKCAKANVEMTNGQAGAEDIEAILAAQETTLAALYKTNKALFERINSADFQTRDANTMCRELRMGNHHKQTQWKSAQARLAQMEAPWFQGKRVLDIGSHDGALDLMLAARFGPKLLIGVDIDHKLTNKAMKNMHECINNSETMALIQSELQENKNAEEKNEAVPHEYQEKVDELVKRFQDLPKSMQLQMQGQVGDVNLVKRLSGSESLPAAKDMKSFLYGKVSFRTENYISSIKPSEDILLKNEKFDTIMCLGTTKYIHLNFGDQGINALFLKVYHQLESGGIFVLQPQQWKSYKKEQTRCSQFKEMLNEIIKLKPGLFLRYLKAIGFELVKTIPGENQEAIIYVLKKP